MNNFIFYKGKYYTKDMIKSLHYCNEFNYNIAIQSVSQHGKTIERFRTYVKKNMVNVKHDIFLYALLISLIFTIGIKIGTLL